MPAAARRARTARRAALARAAELAAGEPWRCAATDRAALRVAPACFRASVVALVGAAAFGGRLTGRRVGSGRAAGLGAVPRLVCRGAPRGGAEACGFASGRSGLAWSPVSRGARSVRSINPSSDTGRSGTMRPSGTTGHLPSSALGSRRRSGTLSAATAPRLGRGRPPALHGCCDHSRRAGGAARPA